MSDRYVHKGRMEFVCVDKDPEAIPGLGSDINAALLHPVSVECNFGIPCPPYVEPKDLACVVCTK